MDILDILVIETPFEAAGPPAPPVVPPRVVFGLPRHKGWKDEEDEEERQRQLEEAVRRAKRRRQDLMALLAAVIAEDDE